MSTYVISGGDAQSICRRRMLRSMGQRTHWIARIVEEGRQTCAGSMARYLDKIGGTLSSERIFRPCDVADGLLITVHQVRVLADRLGMDATLYSMVDALRMLEELGKAPE